MHSAPWNAAEYSRRRGEAGSSILEQPGTLTPPVALVIGVEERHSWPVYWINPTPRTDVTWTLCFSFDTGNAGCDIRAANHFMATMKVEGCRSPCGRPNGFPFWSRVTRGTTVHARPATRLSAGER